jgi:hypothetical protein
MLNVLTDPDDTLLAMAELEGDSWLWSQLYDSDRSEVRFYRALAWLRKVLADADGEDRSDVFAVVYGDGGINRYYLYGNATIVFSRGHAMSHRAAERAAQLGFVVR